MPAYHSRASSWPVIVDLHGQRRAGHGRSSADSARGLADSDSGSTRSRVLLPSRRVSTSRSRQEGGFGRRDGGFWSSRSSRSARHRSLGGDPALGGTSLTGFSMGGTGGIPDRLSVGRRAVLPALAAVAGRVDSSGAASLLRPGQGSRSPGRTRSCVRRTLFAALAAKIRARCRSGSSHGGADETVPVEQIPLGRRPRRGRQARESLRDDEHAGADHVGWSGEGRWGDRADSSAAALSRAAPSDSGSGLLSCALVRSRRHMTRSPACSESRSVIVSLDFQHRALADRRTGGDDHPEVTRLQADPTRRI